MFLAFVLNGRKSEECNMTWFIAHEANRCTFRVAGVSWKRHFLWIMRNSGYSWHTDMQILVGIVLHADTESILKTSYLFFFLPGAYGEKGDTIVQEEPLCTCFMDTTVHETELCTFWTIQTFVSGKLSFFMHNAWIWAQFDHIAAPLGFRSSRYRALNQKETMLLGVFCFPDSDGSRVLHVLD